VLYFRRRVARRLAMGFRSQRRLSDVGVDLRFDSARLRGLRRGQPERLFFIVQEGILLLLAYNDMALRFEAHVEP